MAEQKTRQNDASVQAFIQAQPNEERRQDCAAIIDLMQRLTGEPPKMWGDAIIGFGHRHYKYASGHEGDTFLTGFSPRKQNFSIYLNYGFDDDQERLARLGKHKTGKACLYIKRLADVDRDVLEEMIAETLKQH
jgi:hypothetical protein